MRVLPARCIASLTDLWCDALSLAEGRAEMPALSGSWLICRGHCGFRRPFPGGGPSWPGAWSPIPNCPPAQVHVLEAAILNAATGRKRTWRLSRRYDRFWRDPVIPALAASAKCRTLLRSKNRTICATRRCSLHFERDGRVRLGVRRRQLSRETCRASVARHGQSRKQRCVDGEPAGSEFHEQPHALGFARFAMGEEPKHAVPLRLDAWRSGQLRV